MWFRNSHTIRETVSVFKFNCYAGKSQHVQAASAFQAGWVSVSCKSQSVSLAFFFFFPPCWLLSELLWILYFFAGIL